MKKIDVRSDTVTRQPEEMIQAMACAEVGDDVYRDDPTVNELEKAAARIAGKPDALFVLSGTMGNQLAIKSQTSPSDRVLIGAHGHSFTHEAGAPGLLSGVNMFPISNPDDRIYPEDIAGNITSSDIHEPHTSLLVLENALSNGTVVPVELMKADYATAKEAGLCVHLDGARLFNAAVFLHCDVREITSYADTVMFCLSKGLCAPVGSILAGPTETIEKARRYRKMIGGGIRQGGYLAACGLYALEHMVDRLEEDHRNAKYLARELAKIPQIELEPDMVEINMVFFRITKPRYDEKKFLRHLSSRGILCNPPEKGTYRFVTHWGVTQEDCAFLAGAVRQYLE